MMLSHVDPSEESPSSSSTSNKGKSAAKLTTPGTTDPAPVQQGQVAMAEGSAPKSKAGNFVYEMAEASDEDDELSEPEVGPTEDTDKTPRPANGDSSRGPLKRVTDLPRATPPPKLIKEVEEAAAAAAGPSGTGGSAGKASQKPGTAASGAKPSSAKLAKADPNQRSISSFFSAKPNSGDAKPAPGTSARPIVVDSDSDSELSQHEDSEDSSTELSVHTDSSETAAKKAAKRAKKKGKGPATDDNTNGAPAGTPKKKKVSPADGPNGASPPKGLKVDVTTGNKKKISSKENSPSDDTASDKAGPSKGAAKKNSSGTQKTLLDGMVIHQATSKKSPVKKQQSLDNVLTISPTKINKNPLTGDKLRIHEASMAYQIYRTERNLGFREMPVPLPPGHPKKVLDPPLRDDFDYRIARASQALPEMTEIKTVADVPADALQADSMTWRRLTPSEWAMAAEVAEFLYVWGADSIAVEDEPEPPKHKAKGRRRKWSKQAERKPGTMWEEGVLERDSCELTNFMRTIENPEECTAFFLKIYSRLFFRLQPDVEPPAGELLIDYPHMLTTMIVSLLPSKLAATFTAHRPEVIPPHIHIRALSHLINQQFSDLDAFHGAYEDTVTALKELEREKRDREKRRKELALEMEEAKKATSEALETVNNLEKELESITVPREAEYESDRQKALEARKKTETDRNVQRSKIKHAVAEHNVCKRKESSLEAELERLEENEKDDEDRMEALNRQLNRGRSSSAMRDCGKDRYGRVWWWIDFDTEKAAEPEQEAESPDVEIVGESADAKGKGPAAPVSTAQPTRPFGVMIESWADLDKPEEPPAEESKFFYFSNFYSLMRAIESLNQQGIRERFLKNQLVDELKKRNLPLSSSKPLFGGDKTVKGREDAYQVFLDTVVGNRGQPLNQPEVDIEAMTKEDIDCLLRDLHYVIPAFHTKDLESHSFEAVLRQLATKVQTADPSLVPHEYKVQIAKSVRALEEATLNPDGGAAGDVEMAPSVQETASNAGDNEDEEPEIVVKATLPSLSGFVISTFGDLHVWCLRLADAQRVYEAKIAKEMSKKDSRATRDLRQKAADSGRRVAALRAGSAIFKESRDSTSEDEVTSSRATRSNTIVVDSRKKRADSFEPSGSKRAAAVRAAQKVTETAAVAKGEPETEGAKDEEGSDSGESNASFKEKSSETSEDELMADASESEEAAETGSEEDDDDDDEGKRRSLRTKPAPKSKSKPAHRASSRNQPRKLKRKSRSSGSEGDEDEEESEEEAPRRKLVRRRLASSEESSEKAESAEEIEDSSSDEATSGKPQVRRR